MFSQAWDSKCEPSRTYSYNVCPSWGLIKALLFALMFVVYPVAQISIYKPMFGLKNYWSLVSSLILAVNPLAKVLYVQVGAWFLCWYFPLSLPFPHPRLTAPESLQMGWFTYSGSESGVSGREHTALSLSAWLLVWNAFCMCWLSSDWSWGRWIEPRRIMESKNFNNIIIIISV